jgi:uncharacterized integral membrane protein
MTNTQETLNSIFIDILKGARDVGHDVVVASKEGIVKAVDFAQEQAPIVVQEFLKWKFCEALFYSIGSIIILILIGIVAYRSYKCVKSSSFYSSDIAPTLSIFALVGTVVAGPIIMATVTVPRTLEAIKIQVAPRVYMIEYGIDTLKK